ncbi:MAG: acyltransferase family protein [Actinomycetaceae bacterium]|nr:acyltransferase family protein [Actinomycetaceae bacterium]
MSTSTPTRQRLHGLDAARGFALLLGVVLHSLMPFIPEIGTQWLVVDNQSTLWALLFLYLIHLFRMTTFMLLAGYFARMVVQRKGVGTFLKDRSKRILLPGAIFWPLLVLPLGPLAAWGYQYRGMPLPTQTVGSQYTVGHLWFLFILYYCILLTLGLRALLSRILGSEKLGKCTARVATWLSKPWGFLIPALAMWLALNIQGGDPTSGVDAPGFILPYATHMIAYGSAFLSGWLLHRIPDSMHHIGRRWAFYFVPGLLLAVAAFVISGIKIPFPLASAVSLASWLLTFGFIGFAVRYFSSENRVIRYLADSSYWVYLVHLLLLVAIEIPLADLSLPIVVKLLITWVGTVIIALGTYHFFIRGTWVGKWLNGHRRGRGAIREKERAARKTAALSQA